MDSIKLKNNNQGNGQQDSCSIADEIYHLLNQGSLYEIHQVWNQIESNEQKQFIHHAFVDKFNFDFLRYI